MYDWKGRFIEEDDDMRELRRHCTHCGAFLPVKPQEVKRSIPSKWETHYDEQGEITGMTIIEEEDMSDFYWICTRCGHEHDGDEMWA